MAVTKEEMAGIPKIVAMDFDGTLVEDMYPYIGQPNEYMFNICKALKASGVKLILWTCRDGTALLDAVSYCDSKGLVFDAVNENIKEIKELYKNDTRKVFADLYIDDKSIPHVQDPFYWVSRVGVNSVDFCKSMQEGQNAT